MERDFGLELPRWLQIDFSSSVQTFAEERETEVDSAEIFELFEQTYMSEEGTWRLGNYQVSRVGHTDELQAELHAGTQVHKLSGAGSGVVASFVDAMQRYTGQKIVLVEYSEHALSKSVDAEAICYIQLNIGGARYCGVGRSHDIIQASLNGILGAINVAARHNRIQAA